MTPNIRKNSNSKWTEEQLKLAFHLYCQLPFGKLDRKTPQVIKLAQIIGRTPSAVAMKLVNFASLDPAIIDSGRSGLSNASVLDKKIWAEFHADWDSLTSECDNVLQRWNVTKIDNQKDYTGHTRNASVKARIRQNFFRETVLASYQTCCCMSGVSHRRLLIASHIKPWSVDSTHRLNPRNGLCLSAIHDRAFDCGLITVRPDLTIEVSSELKSRKNEGEQTRHLIQLEGQKIKLPQKFQPQEEFLIWHNQNIYKG